jgi:hypothetical protein
MYCCKPKWHTRFKKRWNALTASDLKDKQNLQALLSLSIYRQHQARNLLFLALGMRCHCKRRGMFIFLAMLFNYLQKVRQTKLLIGVNILFMTVFPEQEIHPTIHLAINCTFDSLDEDWCYENTQFTADQLRLIHLYLDLSPFLYVMDMPMALPRSFLSS